MKGVSTGELLVHTIHAVLIQFGYNSVACLYNLSILDYNCQCLGLSWVGHDDKNKISIRNNEYQ